MLVTVGFSSLQELMFAELWSLTSVARMTPGSWLPHFLSTWLPGKKEPFQVGESVPLVITVEKGP